MKKQFNVGDIVVTSNKENIYIYNEKYLILKIKKIRKVKSGNIYYKCKVLNDEFSFCSNSTYGFFDGEIQQPNKNQLIEINKNYLRGEGV